MRHAPLSPESDYSLLSSLDALSLSTGTESRRQSSGGSGRGSDSEDILVTSAAALRRSKRLQEAIRGNESTRAAKIAESQPSTGSTRLSTDPTPPINIITSTLTKAKPTRRSGKNNRRRQERLYGPTRDEVHDIIGSQTWDQDSEDGASLLLDDHSIGTSEGKVNSMLGLESYTTGSVMSMEDAVSSIDEFFEEPETFMSSASNKLRLWQSLCVELGVARPPVDLTEPAAAHSSVSPSSSRSVTPTGSRAATPTPGDRSATPVPQLADVPTSLRQCNTLLKTVHINLVDYLQRRQLVREAGDSGETTSVGYTDLLFPGISALRRYTIKHQKFAKLDTVKADWLTPLLCPLNGRSRRVAA